MTPSAAPNPAGIRPPGRSPYRGPTQVNSAGTTGVVQVMGSTATTASGDLTPILRRPSEALQIQMHFSGHGGEYFRIWIVNVLLTILTLSLYRPWARLRTLRYFYGHTRLERYALDFHGNPWRMLLGHVLIGMLLVGQAVSGVPTLRTACLVALALLWPALFRSALQFRMANTSWRGMRFRFLGGLPAAYVLFVMPVALLAVAGVAGAVLPPSLRGAAVLGSTLGFILLVPYFLWLLKRYQHDNMGYAQYRTEFRSGVGAFYGLYVRTGMLALAATAVALALFVGAGILTLGTGTLSTLLSKAIDRAAPSGFGMGLLLRIVALVVFAYALFLLANVPVRAYFTARMQDLVWSRTGSRIFRFKSELSARALAALMLKNTVLNLLTLWLYYPYGKIEIARLRIEAVTLFSRTSLDELVNFADAKAGDAAGDAAGDLLGVDLGM